jgi:prolipoprotein diacylglyceryltransferase
VPIAVFAFDFDPYLHFGEQAVRLDTLGVAVAVLIALVGAAIVAGRTPARDAEPPGAVEASVAPPHLRRDDLLFVVLGIVPGAVIGGRIGYALLHLDYYVAHPATIVDPGQGSLQLSGALILGALSGAYVARLLDGSVGRWFHVAAIPALGGLVVGKVAMALGGSGQGAPWDGALATAYTGGGPWGSLDPATPAWPAQLIEAGLTLAVLVVVVLLLAAGAFRARDGRLFLVALGLWAMARFGVAFTWRDPPVAGPLRADQLISMAIAAGCILLVVRGARRVGRAGQSPPGPEDDSPIENAEPSGSRSI